MVTRFLISFLAGLLRIEYLGGGAAICETARQRELAEEKHLLAYRFVNCHQDTLATNSVSEPVFLFFS